MKHTHKPARQIGLEVLLQVFDEHKPLALALDSLVTDHKEASFIKALCFNVCRYYGGLNQILDHYTQKPLRNKDIDIKLLTLLGIYELIAGKTKVHAVVNETVSISQSIKKKWAKAFINGILRNVDRDIESIREDFYTAEKHFPNWLKGIFKKDFPNQLEQILKAQLTKAPLTIRINLHLVDYETYLKQLDEEGTAYIKHPTLKNCLYIEPACPVDMIPGFDQGLFAVQEEASIQIAHILKPDPSDHVLELCAAPGGKSCHLLSEYPPQSLTMVDIEANRMQKLEQNLQRQQLPQPGTEIHKVVEDALVFLKGCQTKYDKILLDAPCSALGVIRRQPDIIWQRDYEQLQEIVALQKQLLQAAFDQLKSGGTMLYSTCSISQKENSQQVEDFLAQNNQASLLEPAISNNYSNALKQDNSPLTIGFQLLPKQDIQSGIAHDGFYYALLKKS